MKGFALLAIALTVAVLWLLWAVVELSRRVRALEDRLPRPVPASRETIAARAAILGCEPTEEAIAAHANFVGGTAAADVLAGIGKAGPA